MDFFVRRTGSGFRIPLIHFDRFRERFAKVCKQFVAGATLGVHTGDLFDPSDPPRTVFTNNGSKAMF